MLRAALWLLAGLGLNGCAYYYPVPVPVSAPPSAPAPTPTQDSAKCRQFTRMITIDGKEIQAIGYACEQPDGTWRLM